MRKRILSALLLVLIAGCGVQPANGPLLREKSANWSGLSARTLFQFTSFKPPVGAKLVGSGTYKGMSFKGSAVVNRFDDQHVDLVVNVRKALVINADVHLVIEAQEDGTVKFLAKRLDTNANEQTGLLQIKEVGKDQSVFCYSDGKLVTLKAQGPALDIAYGDCTVHLSM